MFYIALAWKKERWSLYLINVQEYPSFSPLTLVVDQVSSLAPVNKHIYMRVLFHQRWDFVSCSKKMVFPYASIHVQLTLYCNYKVDIYILHIRDRLGARYMDILPSFCQISDTFDQSEILLSYYILKYLPQKNKLVSKLKWQFSMILSPDIRERAHILEKYIIIVKINVITLMMNGFSPIHHKG